MRKMVQTFMLIKKKKMFSQATTRSFCYIFLKDCGWLEEKLVPTIEDFFFLLLLCDSLTWPLLNVLGHL